MKIIFFTGKGGVGKSTTSAMTAIKKADQGFKTRLISLDPAHNLHDLFHTTLKERPKKVLPNLYVSETSPEYWETKYLDETKNEYNKVYRSKQAINIEKYFDVLKYSPGIEEYSLLLAMEEAIKESKDFDYLIFDTPPTALTLRILELPEKSLIWLHNLLELRNLILEKKDIKNKIMGNRTNSGKSDPILDKLSFLKKRYTELQEILTNKDKTSVNIVMNPDKLSLSESKDIFLKLDSIGIVPQNIIMNKMDDTILVEEPTFSKIKTTMIFKTKIPPDTVESIRLIDFPLDIV